ncbi:MAG: AAA family ATPase [Acidimicrobiales bacterium]
MNGLLVLLGGLPGAGKSTLAAALTELLHQAGGPAPTLRMIDKDQVRVAMCNPADHSFDESAMVDAATLGAAAHHLGQGRLVVLDGFTFARQDQEAMARAVARDAAAGCLGVMCRVSTAVAMERCGRQQNHPAMNRTPELVVRVAGEFAQRPPGWEDAWLMVDTGRPVASAADQVARAVAGLRAGRSPDG